MTEMKKRREAVVDLSVYNALNYARMDLTADQIVAGLCMSWEPAWAPVADVITSESVLQSAARLEGRGLVAVDGNRVTIPVRGHGGLGRPVRMNKRRDALVIQGGVKCS